MISSPQKDGELMTIWQRMDELNMSRYQLSKDSGLSWTEVSDICCGKVPLLKCENDTREKLANSLNLPVAALSELETGPQEQASVQEIGIPDFLQKSINDCIRGESEQCGYLDCLYDDLYGSINSAQWGGDITKEQADYLRKKYLFGENQENKA